MKIEHVVNGISVSCGLGLVIALAGGITSEPRIARASGAENCQDRVDPGLSYPTIPNTDGPDIIGEAGVMLYIQPERALVELDGCIYELDRPLIVDTAAYDAVSVLVELLEPRADSRVFVTESGTWIETITEPIFSYVLTDEHELGFELASPTQMLPTKPPVIAKPK